MAKRIGLLIVLLIMAFVPQGSTSHSTAPQFAGYWDSEWNKTPVRLSGQSISAVAIGNDQSVYVGGHFDYADDIHVNNVARWDGTAWHTLANGLPAQVSALTFSNNALYAATVVNGYVQSSQVYQWDGSQWLTIGNPITEYVGYNNPVISTIAVFQNNLYVGGEFTFADGVRANSLARWDGSDWQAVANGATFANGRTGLVKSLVANNSMLYVGGGFTSTGTLSTSMVAAWNGSAWSSWNSGIQGSYIVLPPTVHSLINTPDGLYAGGWFYGGNLLPRQPILNQIENLAHWNGTTWTQPITTPPITALAWYSNTLVYVNSLYYTGDEIHGLNGDPALDTVVNGRINRIMSDGERLIAVGSFTTINGIPANGIAEYTSQHGWHGMGKGISHAGKLYTLATQGDNLYVGGYFNSIDAIPTNIIARWDGIQWYTVGQNVKGYAKKLVANSVQLLALIETNLSPVSIIGGSVKLYDWNGYWREVFVRHADIILGVTNINIGSNGVYASGYFSGLDSATVQNLAYRPNGNSWQPVTQPPYFINLMTIFQNTFVTNNNNQINHLNEQTWLPLGNPLPNQPYLLIGFDSELYTCVRNSANQTTTIYHWNGATWFVEAIVSGTISDLYIDEQNGDLYIAGSFSGVASDEQSLITSANNIAVLHSGAWYPLGSGTNGNVNALKVHQGFLYIVGSFNNVNGQPSEGIARWKLTNKKIYLPHITR